MSIVRLMMSFRRIHLFLALEEEIEWVHAVCDCAADDWHVVEYEWWFIGPLD